MGSAYGISANPADFVVKTSDQRLTTLIKSQEQLASGHRINRAADDAAGSAIYSRMGSINASVKQASENIQQGISLLQSAEGGLMSAMDILQRMRTLTLQAMSGTVSDDDRLLIQEQIEKLKNNLTQIADETSFGGDRKLLNGTNKADVVVVFDITGSMRNFADAAAEQLQTLVSRLKKSEIDVQVAFIGYKDAPEPPHGSYPDYGPGQDQDQPFDVVELNSDINSVLERLEYYSSNTSGGADLPEAGLEALKAVQDLFLRQNSIRNVIWVTDADVHDENDGDNPGEDDGKSIFDIDAVARQLAAESIQVNALNTDPTRSSAQVLSGETGGRVGTLSATAGNMNAFFFSMGDQIISETGRALTIQTGTEAGDTLRLNAPGDVRLKSLGLTDLDLTSMESARAALAKIDSAVTNVTQQMDDISAQVNRLEGASDNRFHDNVGLERMISQGADVDLAQAIGTMVKEQVINRVGTSFAVQANTDYRSRFVGLLDQLEGVGSRIGQAGLSLGLQA